MDTGRYTVGEVYPFVHCKFRGAGPFGLAGSSVSERLLYKPWWPQHQLLNLAVVAATCKEHHKVAWDVGDANDKKYDGYVFVDNATPPRRWFNQYPAASYGQLSNECDRLLQFDFESAGLSVDDAIKLEESDTGMFYLQDGCSFLSSIRRGIEHFRQQETKDQRDAWERVAAIAALFTFEQRVQKLMEEAMQKKLRIMQLGVKKEGQAELTFTNFFRIAWEGSPAFTCTAIVPSQEGSSWFMRPLPSEMQSAPA